MDTEQPADETPKPSGWGSDADPQNDPTYPLKRHTGTEHAGLTWTRPAPQPVSVEILKSNERPTVSAVFGTSVPPSGLSGRIRRFAFGYSESSYGHWLPLMLADRVNMVEGIFHDIRHGRVPNVFAERGWGAEWKYNRRSLVIKSLGTVVIAMAIAKVFRRRR